MSFSCHQINRILWKSHERVNKQSRVVKQYCGEQHCFADDSKCETARFDWNKRMNFFSKFIKLDSDHCRVKLNK